MPQIRAVTHVRHASAKVRGRDANRYTDNALAVTRGTRVGVYEITAPIGEGGMGQVYRATDTRLKRQVAIKILPPSFATDQDRLARFQREAELLASLNHPNVAAIYGLEEYDGVAALVMELVDGEDLSQRIDRGPIAVDEALPIARQIADALGAAHEQGIVHRDLKPANIKLRPDGTVKVLDFGLAKLTDPTAASTPGAVTMSPTMMSPAMTHVGVILGTAAYMSPEQARGRTVDKRADIWAFGVVVYEMLVGTRPFTGDDITETLASIVRDAPDLEKAPPPVRKLLRRCLEKDPQRRLRDIGDTWDLLDDDAVRATAAPMSAPTWRRLAPWAIAGAVAVLAAAFGIVHFLEPAAATPNVVRFQISVPQLTAGNGTPSVSPDGRRIVYQANNRIFVRDLDAVAPRVLTTTDAAVGAPFWSADSRFVIFIDGGKLTKIDASGGPPRVLCDSPGVLRAGFGAGENTIVFMAAPGGLRQVSADGGLSTSLGRDDVVVLDGGLHPLPGGRVLYVTESGVYAASLDGTSAPVQIASSGMSHVAYLPANGRGDDQLLFVSGGALQAQSFDTRTLKLSGEPTVIAERVGGFSASETGTIVYRDAGEGRRLVWMNRQGEQTGTAWAPDQFNELSLSPDGSKVAVVRETGVSTWVHDFARESSVQLSSTRSVVKPVWSPDGATVVFAANREGHFDIYSAPARGGGPDTVILKSAAMKYPLSWSKDGKWLLFTNIDPATREDLWVLPMSGTDAGKPEPFLATNYRETDASFSPDGRFVAYVSDESGTSEVYVREFPPSTGGKWVVSRGGGYQPRWRSDGKELLYVSGRGQLMSVEAHAATIGAASGASHALFSVPIYGGGATINNWYWDVAAGGERMLFNTGSTETGASLVTVLVNWRPTSRTQAAAR